MRDTLIRWIGKNEGQTDAYQHIIDATKRHDFNKDNILNICQSMIEQLAPKIEADQVLLNAINAKQDESN